jgi:ferric-dicitrate binding protein FerR (iron transport regulator)
MLSQNEKGVYSKTNNRFIRTEKEDPNILSWKTKRLDFYNTGLVEVFETLEKTYGVEFIITNPDLNSCRLTAIYNNKSVTDILAIMRATFALQFSRSGDNTIVVNGTPCNK